MEPLPSSLLSVTFGLAVVLLSRRPARRLFGAGPAFTLWLLPLLLGVLPWLPLPSMARPAAAEIATLPATQAFIIHAMGTVAATSYGLIWLWLCGCTCLLLRLGFHFRRLHHNGKALPQPVASVLQQDLPGLDTRCVRVHPAGPAVFWSRIACSISATDFVPS